MLSPLQHAASHEHSGASTEVNYYCWCLHAPKFSPSSILERVLTKHRENLIRSSNLLLRGLSQQCLWSDNHPECSDGEKNLYSTWEQQTPPYRGAVLSMEVNQPATVPAEAVTEGLQPARAHGGYPWQSPLPTSKPTPTSYGRKVLPLPILL